MTKDFYTPTVSIDQSFPVLVFWFSFFYKKKAFFNFVSQSKSPSSLKFLFLPSSSISFQQLHFFFFLAFFDDRCCASNQNLNLKLDLLFFFFLTIFWSGWIVKRILWFFYLILKNKPRNKIKRSVSLLFFIYLGVVDRMKRDLLEFQFFFFFNLKWMMI